MSESWRDEFNPGDVVEGSAWDSGEDKHAGIVLRGDDGDHTMMILIPQVTKEHNELGDAWDIEWIRTTSAVDISDSEVARDLRRRLPFDHLSPEYIFMVIRPKRKITTYANLDALVAGMIDGDDPKATDRELRLHEAAALAIADPETDIKIPPGASNSPWLRFTQVEGA